MSVFESFLVLALLCSMACAGYKEFERVPEDTTVIEGLSVVLGCQVYEGYRRYDFFVYWEINGNIINPWTSKTNRYTLIEDRAEGIYDLKIRAVTEEDEGEYICVMDLPDPYSDGRSSPGELTVIRIPIPSFSQEPENTLVAQGETGTLSCHVGNFTEEHLYVSWFKDHKEMLSVNDFTNDSLPVNMNNFRYSIQKQKNGEITLKITNASRRDAGNYSCLVTIKNGDRILESRQAILSVAYHECYPGNVQSYRKVYQEGDNITTVCTAGLQGYQAAGNDLISVAWIRGGDEFPGSRELRQKSEIKSTMSWSLTAADDKNPFMCQIKYSNQLNQVICRIDPISVHFAPKVEILSIGFAGRNLLLLCSANASPEVIDYSWLVDDKVVRNAESRYQVEKGGRQLTIHDTNMTDNGVKVECIARNEMKSSSASTLIRIIEVKPSSAAGNPSSEKDVPQNMPCVAMSTFVIVVVVLVLIIITLIGVMCRLHRSLLWTRKDIKVTFRKSANPSTRKGFGETRVMPPGDLSSPESHYIELTRENSPAVYSSLFEDRQPTPTGEEVITVGPCLGDSMHEQVDKLC